MAKGKAVRQREKRIHSTISRQSNKEVINDKTTFTNHENFPSHSFWKYSSFTILALLSSMALFCSKDSLLSSQTLSSKNAFHDSEENAKLQFPCHVGDEWSIDRRSNLSLEEFVLCYDAKRPVLITDVVMHWKAINWTKSFLVKNYGDKRVTMKATEGPMNAAKGFAVPLKMFAQHAHEGKPQLWTYLEDELFIEMNPELKKHLGQPVYLKEDFFQLLPKELRPWNAMLLWGTAHSRSSLHIDPYNWTGTNAVLSGKKMWKLYPPGQDHLLYVRGNQRSGFPLDCMKYNSPIDTYVPDYKLYPQFKKARAITFTQEAGEILIIPTGWFHQAYNPVETMAISSQVWNSQNYKLILEEIYKAGEVDPRKLPRNFNSLSAKEQVEAVVKIIPKAVIRKGKKVTEDLLEQLKWHGKEKSGRK